MIQTREDLRRYIEADRKAYHVDPHPTLKQRILEIIYPDNHLRYLKCLRKLEYYVNHWLLRYWYPKKLARLREKTGIELFQNVAGPGLHISHGKIVVSLAAKIEENCKILSDVTIGGQGRYDRTGAPVIGDRVFIGTGAKIIGNITVAGTPARKVNDTCSYHFLSMEQGGERCKGSDNLAARFWSKWIIESTGFWAIHIGCILVMY